MRCLHAGVASVAFAGVSSEANLGWLALSLEDWIAVAALHARFGVPIAAVCVPRRAAGQSSDLQCFNEYNRRYQELISRAPSDIRDPNFVLAGRPDRERIFQLAHAYFDLCFEQWHMHQRGVVTSKLWLFWKSGITAGFSRPAFQQAWTIIREEKRCHLKFLLFVDRLSLCCARKRAVGWLAMGDFLAGTRLN